LKHLYLFSKLLSGNLKGIFKKMRMPRIFLSRHKEALGKAINQAEGRGDGGSLATVPRAGDFPL
jgi:hypothetical protein